MIVSDAPNCGVTYDRHNDDHNSFKIQATGSSQAKMLYHPESFIEQNGNLLCALTPLFCCVTKILRQVTKND